MISSDVREFLNGANALGPHADARCASMMIPLVNRPGLLSATGCIFPPQDRSEVRVVML